MAQSKQSQGQGQSQQASREYKVDSLYIGQKDKEGVPAPSSTAAELIIALAHKSKEFDAEAYSWLQGRCSTEGERAGRFYASVCAASSKPARALAMARCGNASQLRQVLESDFAFPPAGKGKAAKVDVSDVV